MRPQSQEEIAIEQATNPNLVLVIDYTNHTGLRQMRKIVPIAVEFMQAPGRAKRQWTLRAYDTERRVFRNFTMTAIHSTEPSNG